MKSLTKHIAKSIAATVFTAVGIISVQSADAQSRNQLRIVGSSTVYPFSSYVAEEFGATTKYPTPVVESTGSGGGMKLFSKGDGMDTPDITNASRRMKVSEYKRCVENGVTDITEAKIGYDGITVAHNVENDPVNLTLKELTLAVAAKVPKNGRLVKNKYVFWDQIDEDLPHRKITIFGPPTTSGTRDAFEELVMEAATEDIAAYDGAYTKIRTDGLYVPSGENDNLIVQKLSKNKAAFGIFGYSFLAENKDKIQGASINGVDPTPEAISSGDYPISRSLFFYIKNDHIDKVQGMTEFVKLFMSEKMIGPDGYLKDLGLISLQKKMRKKVRARVMERATLELEGGNLVTDEE